MKINRKQIFQTFLRIMSHIADNKYQKRVWINGEGSEVDDFDETVCHFFQESEGIIGKYQEFGLTENQCDLLRKFRDAFGEFSDNHDIPEEFIDSAEWEKIMNMAKEILEVFGYQKFRD